MELDRRSEEVEDDIDDTEKVELVGSKEIYRHEYRIIVVKIPCTKHVDSQCLVDEKYQYTQPDKTISLSIYRIGSASHHSEEDHIPGSLVVAIWQPWESEYRLVPSAIGDMRRAEELGYWDTHPFDKCDDTRDIEAKWDQLEHTRLSDLIDRKYTIKYTEQHVRQVRRKCTV
jgi:hypothetical protein